MYQSQVDRERKDPLYMQSNKLESSHEITLAEDFTQLYYDKLDKQQYQVVSRLYLPQALQVWNGISNSGIEKIQQFLSQLPQSTHTVMSLDTQRLHENATENKTFLIKTGGIVRFKDHGTKQFFHTFFTTMVDGKYKISIDNYRCTDGTP
ncbi:hypothetical protein PGB90_009912 [Kerria lacca]